ncbi:hypothetical protein FBU30_004617 [Linnemannia zychae]|nr:hypothetical protein FBU30_004617 [Linnemannia zychae]
MARFYRNLSHSRGYSQLLNFAHILNSYARTAHIHPSGTKHFSVVASTRKNSSGWTDVTSTFESKAKRSYSRSDGGRAATTVEDPFDKLDGYSSRGRDRDRDRDRERDNWRDRDRNSGKFGRSSFPSRENTQREDYRGSRQSKNDRENGDRRERPKQNMPTDHDFLYSPNVVFPALRNGLREAYNLYYSHTLTQNRKRTKVDPVADCINMAKQLGIPVKKKEKHDLNEMAGQRPHQGVILEASQLKKQIVDGLGPISANNNYQLFTKAKEGMAKNFASKENQPPVWLALDEVVDPQNLGAILRTSLFLGVDGVVVCHKNSAPLSPVVAKASAGALEERPTYSVDSLGNFIKKSQKNGWYVVGADVANDSKRNRSIQTWPETGVDQPTLLIMGSEGDGLRKHIKDLCDSFVQIPTLSSDETGVDSLNVSVATGIILSRLMGGRFLQLPKNLKKFPHRPSNRTLRIRGNHAEESEDEEISKLEDNDDEDYDDTEEEEEEEEENQKTKNTRNSFKKSNMPF